MDKQRFELMSVAEKSMKMKKRSEELKKVTKPLIDFLYEYGDPYTSVIVTQVGVELVQSECHIPFELRD